MRDICGRYNFYSDGMTLTSVASVRTACWLIFEGVAMLLALVLAMRVQYRKRDQL